MIIDLPQAIDAAGNNSAAGMLLRDVANLTAWFGRFAPELLATDYGREIWAIYLSGKLHPEIALSGRFERSEQPADLQGSMREIDEGIRAVLVVEDEGIVAMMIEDLLREMGVKNIHVCPDAASALKLVDGIEIDLALLDLRTHDGRTNPGGDALAPPGPPGRAGAPAMRLGLAGAWSRAGPCATTGVN